MNLYSSQKYIKSSDSPYSDIDIDDSGSNNSIIKSIQPVCTPRSEMSENIPLTHSFSSIIFNLDEVLSFDSTPFLMEVNDDQIIPLFKQKCQQLCQICNFTIDEQVLEKEAKTQMLEDMFQFVSSPKIALLTESEYISFYRFFAQNVFRVPPNPPEIWFGPCSVDFKIDRMEEAGWTHIALAYDCIVAFIKNERFRPKFFESIISSFIRHLVDLFSTPDWREHSKLQLLYHAVYSTFQSNREQIRKHTADFLIEYRYKPPCLGVAEILHVYVSIIKGFKSPLHLEHLAFFHEALLPLHRSPNLHFYHPELVLASFAFIEKDRKLATHLINELTSRWPFTNATKALLFLSELMATIDYCSVNDSKVAMILTPVLCRCFEDQNFAVVEGALLLWKSDTFTILIANSASLTYPLLLPSLLQCAHSNWNKEMKDLAVSIIRVLKGSAPEVFAAVCSRLKASQSTRVVTDLKRGSEWVNIIENSQMDQEKKDRLTEAVSKMYIGCESLFCKKINQ